MAERIVLRTGEALQVGGPPGTAAEPEIVIGELDGPVGTALATLLGDQVKGHTRVFAILNSDVQVRPATLMVSKVTVRSGGTRHPDGHGAGRDRPRRARRGPGRRHPERARRTTWASSSRCGSTRVLTCPRRSRSRGVVPHQSRGTAKAIRKAMRHEPSIDWLLENQDKVVHRYFQMGLEGKI